MGAVRLMTLATVLERGGVVAAAEALHLTPSAVSQQLRQLEVEAGVPLLDRSGRTVRLTEAGRQLAARGRRIREEVVRAGDDLAPWTDAPERTLTVAAFQTAICQLVAPVVGSGALGARGLTLRVVEVEGAEALRDLHAGVVDVVLREEMRRGADGGAEPDDTFGAGVDGDIQTRLVVDDRYRVVVPTAWDLPAAPETARADLVRRPWVVQAAGTAGGDLMVELQDRWGFAAQVTHVCVEYTSAVALVGVGAGATLAPHLAMPLVEAPGGADPAVRLIELSPDLGARRIRALCRPTRRPSAAIQHLLTLLAAQARALGLQARLPEDVT